MVEWDVFDDLCGSDHFPLVIDFPNISTHNGLRPKFILKKADWVKYKRLAETNVDTVSNTIDQMVLNFTNTIIAAATKSIPMTSGKFRKKQTPWWNSEIGNAINQRKCAYRLFNRSPTTDNLINFKKCRAKAVYLIKKSKRESWQIFVSSIQPQTPFPLAWKKVQAVMVKQKTFPIRNLIYNNSSLRHK